MKISLLHPFSAKAIGLTESDLFFSHSKPHELALLQLQQEGYGVSIAYFTGNMLPFAKNINGITKSFWPITKPLFKKRHVWRKQHSLFHYWTTYLNPPDVTIINMSGHGSRYCFNLAKMLVKKGKPYIAMIGGIHFSDDMQAAAYYKNAHHIIVHTHMQKKELLKNRVFKNLSIEVMPLGIDTAHFSPTIKNSQKIDLLFVGRITPLKQIEYCIKTVAHLVANQTKDVTLHVVGPESNSNYLEVLKQLAKELKVTDKIIFVGAVSQNELAPYYQQANLLLLPSAHESFGMVMVEAMSCGTPVAALKGSGGPDEIINDGYNGILANEETYSERILEYFDSMDMQQRLQNNARLDVEKNWSLKQTVTAFKKSIAQVFVTL